MILARKTAGFDSFPPVLDISLFSAETLETLRRRMGLSFESESGVSCFSVVLVEDSGAEGTSSEMAPGMARLSMAFWRWRDSMRYGLLWREEEPGGNRARVHWVLRIPVKNEAIKGSG